MEEYIRLKKEKAYKRGKVFNWQTATYGKIRVDDNFYDLRSMEAEFPAIVVNDDFALKDTLQCKSQDPEMAYPYAVLTKSIRHMALPPREHRHRFLRYEGLESTDSDIAGFESRLERIYNREIHKVRILKKWTKTKAKRTKPSTGMKRARDFESDGAFIFYWASSTPFI
ncbi:hypothetical protein Tco_1308937 [Tanacetum coccineum]